MFGVKAPESCCTSVNSTNPEPLWYGTSNYAEEKEDNDPLSKYKQGFKNLKGVCVYGAHAKRARKSTRVLGTGAAEHTQGIFFGIDAQRVRAVKGPVGVVEHLPADRDQVRSLGRDELVGPISTAGSAGRGSL